MYFDIEAHRECFKTNRDEAYFWHGQTNECGGQDNAKNIATKSENKRKDEMIYANKICVRFNKDHI